MAHNPARPLSPHLQIWKWGPHMLVSILHRATGVTMAVGGGLIFTWWLAAAATSPHAYAIFYAWVVEGMTPAQQAANLLAKLIGIGISWAYFQHMASGIRHLIMDVGANFELKRNKTSAMMTLAFSVPATLIFWALIFWGKY